MSMIDTTERDTFEDEAVGNIIRRTLKMLRDDESGYTINPLSGEDYAGSQWIVGGSVPSLVFTGSLDATDFVGQVRQWYATVKALNGALVGGWSHNGTIYLDAVTLIDDREQAVMLGKLWEQVAIGHYTEDGDDFVSEFLD